MLLNLINALSTSYDRQCFTKNQVEQDLSKNKSYGSETQLDEVKEDVEELNDMREDWKPEKEPNMDEEIELIKKWVKEREDFINE